MSEPRASSSASWAPKRLDVGLAVIDTPELIPYYEIWPRFEVGASGVPKSRRGVVPDSIIKPIVEKIINLCYTRLDEVGQPIIKQMKKNRPTRIVGPTIIVMDARAIEIIFESTAHLALADQWGMIRPEDDDEPFMTPQVGCWDGGFEPRIFSAAQREHRSTIPLRYYSLDDDDWRGANGYRFGLEVWLRQVYRCLISQDEDGILEATTSAVLTVKDVIVRNPDWLGKLVESGTDGFKREDRVWSESYGG
ncbi:hypothetical protein K4K59_005788 [Colletotrichum sp. SAR11_240]|nr:hypothetical protein K4K59_005788 [Colletotrichum sp. SAR11_240]